MATVKGLEEHIRNKERVADLGEVFTPEATVGVAIYRDIKKKGAESRFRQVKPSIFALAKAVYKPIENGVSEQAVASKVEEPVSEPVEGVILSELKPIEDKVNLSYGTSLYFERPEI
jgi:hypothetical protein